MEEGGAMGWHCEDQDLAQRSVDAVRASVSARNSGKQDSRFAVCVGTAGNDR